MINRIEQEKKGSRDDKSRKRVFGYEMAGKNKVKRPELVDCFLGPGDVIASSYSHRYVVTNDRSLRRAVIYLFPPVPR